MPKILMKYEERLQKKYKHSDNVSNHNKYIHNDVQPTIQLYSAYSDIKQNIHKDSPIIQTYNHLSIKNDFDSNGYTKQLSKERYIYNEKHQEEVTMQPPSKVEGMSYQNSVKAYKYALINQNKKKHYHMNQQGIIIVSKSYNNNNTTSKCSKILTMENY